jgi:hypothetical protein
MKDQKEQEDSPIVATVRRAREQLDRECDHDFRKYLDLLKREEKASGRQMGSAPRRTRTKR